MKRIFLFLGILSGVAFAQDNKKEAILKYNLFKGDFLAKNYDSAYENWLWCFKNAPKLTLNIYKQGHKLLKERAKKLKGEELKKLQELRIKVYENQIKFFPKNLVKIQSDYAEFMSECGKSEDEYFPILEKAAQENASKMGVKAIAMFFKIFVKKHEKKDVPVIFEAYDHIMKSISEKMDDYQKKLDGYSEKEEKKQPLTSTEKRFKKAYEINSRSLGKVEKILDKTIAKLGTCDRLIPFYTKQFKEDHKDDEEKFLKSAISRMYKKECTDAPLYDKMVETYVTKFPSPEASVFYAGILLKKNQETKAKTYFEKAVQQEEDPYKKAKYLFKIAQIMKKKKSYSQARKYAYQALKYKRSMGDAYLLIARIYARSTSKCGKSEFQKRMVFVAAAEKVYKAIQVDPLLKNVGKKYLKHYNSLSPTKKDIFTEGVKSGTKYKIGCWINETVTIP